MRNWYYFTWLCGDHIVEQHIHNLDVGNWVKDDHPVEANGMGGRQVRTEPKDYGEIFDHHAVEFTYADGTKMFSQCRHIPRLLEQRRGTRPRHQGLRPTSAVRSIDQRRAATGAIAATIPNPHQVEHDDLFAAIRTSKPYNEGDYGAKSTMTAILGRMATYSGKVVKWDEAINSDISMCPSTTRSMPAPTPLVAVPGQTQVI